MKRRIYHPVAWDNEKQPFQIEGLGLRSLEGFNIVPQGKWV